LTEIEKELRKSPLGSFVLDFYQRYNATPGNSRYLKDRCDEADKKVYGQRGYFERDANQTIAYLLRGIASTIVSKIQLGEKMPPISESLREVFREICEENIRRDFKAINTHTLKSCDAVAALLLKGLERIDAERSPEYTLQKQRRQKFEDAYRITQLVLNSLPQIARQQGIDLSSKNISEEGVLNMQPLIDSVQKLGALIGDLAKDSQASPSDPTLDAIRQDLMSFQERGAHRA
jgi:hypothetical protein